MLATEEKMKKYLISGGGIVYAYGKKARL